MRFDVTILGSSSATPVFNRNPSAQILNANEQLFLIDCGEGTQQQLIRNNIKSQRINTIFISHLHGDHYLGLIGLLSSLHLNGRTKPMSVYGPAELKEILDIQFKYSQTELRYPLHFYATQAKTPEVIFENRDLKVETIILEHRIACTGFKFIQKKALRKVDQTRIVNTAVPVEGIQTMKKGRDFTDAEGRVYRFEEFTSAPPAPRSYAYCSDTLCNWVYIEQIKEVNTLYHEATFMHDLLGRATDTFHTTALQAGQIALKANVGQLLLGHFSARYRELEPLLLEAQSVFPNSKLALEGATFMI